MNPTLKKKLFYIFFFICLGFSTEVCFTAFSDLAEGLSLGQPDWSLTGKTYVWMAFIYGLIPFLFGWGYDKVKHLSKPIRLLVYVSFIYLIEFVSGGILDLLLGACPWEYTVGWHIAGYIRLDYFPFWLLFGFILEFLYTFLNEHFIITK